MPPVHAEAAKNIKNVAVNKANYNVKVILNPVNSGRVFYFLSIYYLTIASNPLYDQSP